MKWLKKITNEHAPQCNLVQRNLAVFNRLTDISDPHVHRHFTRLSKNERERVRKPYPESVLKLCKDMSVKDYSDVVFYDVDADVRDEEVMELAYRGIELDLEELENEEDDDEVFFVGE